MRDIIFRQGELLKKTPPRIEALYEALRPSQGQILTRYGPPGIRISDYSDSDSGARTIYASMPLISGRNAQVLTNFGQQGAAVYALGLKAFKNEWSL